MRIMLCPSAYAPHFGGVEELTYRLAGQYQQQGHTVSVVTARWPKSLPAHEVIQGINVSRIDYVMPNRQLRGLARFGLLFPWRMFQLGWIIRQFRPDVVHIQCVSAQGFYLLFLKRLLRFRLVVTLQGERRADAHQIYQRTRLMTPILARLLHRADFVTACSKSALEDISDLWPLGPNSAIVPNGISLEEFDQISEDNSPLVTDRPYIFATGRHERMKGFDLLVEAFSRIAARYPGIDLVIGGDGNEHHNLQAQIVRHELSERVHLPGYLNRQQTVACFRQSLFFVLPSRYEPFGIVNLEAMAAGKAVIGTEVGGVPEIIQPGETGLLVPAENVEALVAAMCGLLDKLEEAEALGQAGRSRLEANFTWTHLSGQYLQIYGRIQKQE